MNASNFAARRIAAGPNAGKALGRVPKNFVTIGGADARRTCIWDKRAGDGMDGGKKKAPPKRGPGERQNRAQNIFFNSTK